jgi:amino acid adenylation domain-containing protein
VSSKIHRIRYNQEVEALTDAQAQHLLAEAFELRESDGREPMSSHPPFTLQIPREQQLIRARCFHPTGTFVEFTKAEIEQSIPARFEQQVRRYPDRLAVKTRTQTLTYDALNRLANRVAHAILALRGAGEEPVALLCAQGALAIAALLGVLKARKFYVPLDPSHPQARLRSILEESQAGLIVTTEAQRSLADALAPAGCVVLNLDTLEARLPSANPCLPLSPDALAYILYTSGSSGQPKGVITNHRNVLHDIMRQTHALHICAEDGLTLLRSYSVIGGLRALLSALLNGAAIYPFDIREEGLARMAAWLQQEVITIYESVATVFRHFVNTLSGQATFPRLRLIRLGGELVYTREVELYRKHFARDCFFVNGLGTTETGTICLYFVDQHTQLSGSIVPAGYATVGTEVLLVDEHDQMVEDNSMGEIVVRSRYLALGYWRRPDLTQAAFMRDPAGGELRCYRTGDVGRWRPDGSLEHLGRKDLQVKIRGYRIECAEIETALMHLPAVKEAVVMRREEPGSDPFLVAYIIPASTPAPSVSTLRHALSEALPDYMVPSSFVILNALPLTPTGKVDRRALPAPSSARPALECAFVAPRTPIEAELVRIWAEVLGLEQMGIHDHFLELGGHSLLATQIVSRVRDLFHVDVPLRSLLEAPTVADMAMVILQSQAQRVGLEDMKGMLAEVDALSGEQPQHLLTAASELRGSERSTR